MVIFLITYKSYLEHHGIKGQKWGVRRTPEQLGHKKPRSTGYKPLRYESLVEFEAKSFLKQFPVAFAATLIPGGSILYNANTIKQVKDNYLDFKDYTKKDGDFEKLSQLKKKKNETPLEVDVKKVNPKGLGGSAGRVKNCVYCSFTMEVRRRGYDVQARRKASGCNPSKEFFNKYFKGATPQLISFEKNDRESHKSQAIRSYQNMCKILEQQGPGASGVLDFDWCKSVGGGGHMIYYSVNKSGEVNFYDGQVGKMNERSTFSLADPSTYHYTRLDNCKLTDNIGEVLMSTKDSFSERRNHK